MVLLLSIAICGAATSLGGEGYSSHEAFADYREAPSHLWQGCDSGALVRLAREAYAQLDAPTSHNEYLRIVARDATTIVPAAEFSKRGEAPNVTLKFGARGVLLYSAEFFLPSGKLAQLDLGSLFMEGARGIEPGEDADWAGPIALSAWHRHYDCFEGAYVERIDLRQASSRPQFGNKFGVASVTLRAPPPGCLNPYHGSVGQVEVALGSRAVIRTRLNPKPPVRPGDVPSIDLLEAEARALAAWQRHLAWPNIRIQVEPPVYWFIADNRRDAAHERTPGQQRCFEEKKWILMYVGKIWDPSSGQNGDPLKICFFQVDAVEGNVINFVDATRRLQALLGTMLSSGSPGGIAPQGPDPPFEPSSAKALSAPGRAPFALEAGLGPSLAAASTERPAGVPCGVRLPGVVREAAADLAKGRLWVRTDGAGWAPYALPAGAAEWLSRPVEGLRPFGS